MNADQGLLRVLPMIRRWWWLVLVGVLVSGLATYVVTKQIRPMYEASAQLFVDTSPATSQIGSYSDSQTTMMLASSIANMIGSYRVAGDVLHTSKVPMSEDSLLKEMSASTAAAVPIITISVRDAIPERAALLANSAASAIIAAHQADQEVRYSSLSKTLKNQLASTTKLLDDYTARLRSISSKAGTDPVTAALVTSLSTQIDTLQSTVASLNSQLNTVMLSQAQSETTLTVIDRAQVPVSPVSPSLRLNLMLAILLSVLLTGGFIVAVEYLDDSVRSPAFMEERLRLPVLGIVSVLKSKKYRPLLVERPWDTNAESFKALRTNVQFINVDQPIQTILIASGSPSEGKTTVAANFAVAVAQAGRRVILVDCDLRRPRQDVVFELGPGRGLTDHLSDVSLGLSVARPTSVANLRVVTCGSIPPNPSELLGSRRMVEFLQLARANADIVVLDSPPALVVTDASVLAPQVDGVLLVVDEQTSKLRAALRTIQLFNLVGARVLGIVDNRFDARRSGYGNYSSSTYSDKYGSEKTADDGGDGGFIARA